MTVELPNLLDCARLAHELGITRSAAERIMQKLPKVRDEDVRKVYVKRADVQKWIDEHTVAA